MCLMQDDATSHIAHKTLSLLAHALVIQSPYLNPIKRNWDVIGRVVRRPGLANIRRFSCTAIFNGRMERNYTTHVECLRYMYVTWVRSRCQTIIEANGGHSRY